MPDKDRRVDVCLLIVSTGRENEREQRQEKRQVGVLFVFALSVILITSYGWQTELCAPRGYGRACSEEGCSWDSPLSPPYPSLVTGFERHYAVP